MDCKSKVVQIRIQDFQRFSIMLIQFLEKLFQFSVCVAIKHTGIADCIKTSGLTEVTFFSIVWIYDNMPKFS